MANIATSVSSLPRYPMCTPDEPSITHPIVGRVSGVLDKCGTPKKLAENFGRIKIYEYDSNSHDVVRDENGIPISVYRDYSSMSTTPWRETATGGESTAQVRYSVFHCELVKDWRGSHVLSAGGGKTFRWSVVAGAVVYVANTERPELVGKHECNGVLEPVILRAQVSPVDVAPDMFPGFDPDLLADDYESLA
jgi:hypothetical protein